MQIETSCGAIVWRKNANVFEFLILRRRDNSVWETPKGHVKLGESESDTAKRELNEELGFENVVLEDGFREIFEYVSSRGVKRRFILFLTPHQKLNLSKEHDKFEWVSTGELSKYYEHEDIINIYKSAEKFLKKKKLLFPSS